jgi:flagellar biosynthesis/type III secretory pathway protein FliH
MTLRTSDVTPFLSTISGAPSPPRSFSSSLAQISTAAATSPWSPQSTASAPPVIDTQAIEAEACERGRQEGLAETAELREQLAAAIAAFTNARAALVTPSAMKIAAAAAAVVGAWTETAAPSELYAPILHAWIAKHDAPATAHVSPSHAEAIKELIQGAPITVIADASLSAGEIRFSSATMELSHSWDQRLPDLRDAIASALESA